MVHIRIDDPDDATKRLQAQLCFPPLSAAANLTMITGLCGNNNKDIERLDNNGDYQIRNYQIIKGKTAYFLSIISIFNKHAMLHIKVATTDECFRYCINLPSHSPHFNISVIP